MQNKKFSFPVALALFQVVNSHVWLAAAILDSTTTKNKLSTEAHFLEIAPENKIKENYIQEILFSLLLQAHCHDRRKSKHRFSISDLSEGWTPLVGTKVSSAEAFWWVCVLKGAISNCAQAMAYQGLGVRGWSVCLAGSISLLRSNINTTNHKWRKGGEV